MVCERYRLHKDMCQVTTSNRVSHFRIDTHYGRWIYSFFTQRKQTEFFFVLNEIN